MAQLEYARDVQRPVVLAFLNGRLDTLRAYAKKGSEAARQAQDLIFGLENALKSYQGEYGGLLDKAVVEKKAAEERDLRSRVDARPELRAEYGDAWSVIAAAMQESGNFLTQTHTVRYLRAGEVLLTRLAERGPWESWENAGRQGMAERAQAKAERILVEHQVEPLSEAQEHALDEIILSAQRALLSD